MGITQLNNILIKGFIVLGPIGKLIPIWSNMHSFRFFYLLLPIGVIVFLFNTKKNAKSLQRIKICVPLIFYSILSAFIATAFYDIEMIDSNNPILRIILFLFLFLFVILASEVAEKFNEEKKIKLIFLYIKGYTISLIVGYVMFIGYYLNVFSLNILEPYHVLLQMGYGLLRFSPGSYPNEYGIVSSFVLSIITLLMIKKNVLQEIYGKNIRCKFLLYFLWIGTLVALFLTTTRAAYIAYLLTLVYLCCEGANIFSMMKRFLLVLIIGFILLILCQVYLYDVVSILTVGYETFTDENASAYERFYAWNEAQEKFEGLWLFGLGFGMANGIHNVYLQSIFELGIIGTLIVIFTIFILAIYENKYKNNKSGFLLVVRNIGLIHVLWFAMSNHNLNHHLTWFCVLLCYICTDYYGHKCKCTKKNI